MAYQIFLPSEKLIKAAQWGIHWLFIIASLAAIFTAMAGTFYILIWLCNVLSLFVHTFSNLCHEIFVAIGGNPLNIFTACITWLMLIICLKATCILYPSLLLVFKMKGARG